MTTLAHFPLVSQRTTITSDGKVSEDALFDCVPASIGACMLWLEQKAQWDGTINPDKLKDAAYGDAYTGGTSAANYIGICKAMGFTLAALNTSSPAQTIVTARQLLAQNKPVIFTMLDPYVDTSLSQYAGWTHVSVWFGYDSAGLTAMDPFIAQPVYKSDATWASLLRANQVWTVERSQTMAIPAGWRDDGTTLWSPNTVQGGPEVPITGPFRDYILATNWPNNNVALETGHHTDQLEMSNATLGGGWQQTFRYAMLGKPDNGPRAGIVIFEWLGQELLEVRRLYAKAQIEIAQLEAQPAGLDAGKVADRLSAIGIETTAFATKIGQLTTQAIG